MRCDEDEIRCVWCICDFSILYFIERKLVQPRWAVLLLRKNWQTKESLGKVPLLRVFPPRRCDRYNKGTWKNSHQDHRQTTAARQIPAHSKRGVCKQEHVCRFCNMQQSSCNYIPPGVSRLQQSGVFFFCQLWQIFTKTRNQADNLRTFKSGLKRSKC